MTEGGGSGGEVIVVDRPWSYVHSKPMRQALLQGDVTEGRGGVVTVVDRLVTDIQYVHSRSMGQAKLQTDMTEGPNGEVIVVDRPWSYVHSKSGRG